MGERDMKNAGVVDVQLRKMGLEMQQQLRKKVMRQSLVLPTIFFCGLLFILLVIMLRQ